MATNEDIARDTFAQLQQLEDFTNSLNQLQYRQTQERQNVKRLKHKVQQLRERKHNLLQQLPPNSNDKQESGYTSDELLTIHKNNLEEIKLAYRLTGKSYERLKNGNILLSWDTFYNGQFYESYHAEIKETTDTLTLQHHSLPCFVPTENLTNILQESIQDFIQTVGLYLNAFVARRQQVLHFQEEHKEKIQGAVKSNPSFTFTQMTIATESVNYNFTVQYHLTDSLPHQVGIGSEGRGYEYVVDLEAIVQYKQLLKTVPLTKAFQEIIIHTSESSSS